MKITYQSLTPAQKTYLTLQQKAEDKMNKPIDLEDILTILSYRYGFDEIGKTLAEIETELDAKEPYDEGVDSDKSNPNYI